MDENNKRIVPPPGIPPPGYSSGVLFFFHTLAKLGGQNERRVNKMSDKTNAELQESTAKCFRWILTEATGTGSARTIAGVMLWLYNADAFPCSVTIGGLDAERAEMVLDMIEFRLRGYEPHCAVKKGHVFINSVKKIYG